MNTQKLVEFLKEKGKGDFVPINDFLKSAYGVPKPNETPEWMSKGEMKRMKIWLSELVAGRKISVNGNRHNQLGAHYYEGPQQYLRFYHLGNLQIQAKLGLDV